MHTFTVIILFMTLWSILPISSARAQFIHFSMKVEPELSSNTIQNLSFGTLTPGSGIKRIEKGSHRMGILEIRALANQYLFVTLNAPKNLTRSHPGSNSQIPISLQASYNTSGNNDIHTARPFSGQTAWFRIGDTTTSTPDARTGWESAFIYIYGDMTIGDVPEGLYTAVLVLNIEYL